LAAKGAIMTLEKLLIFGFGMAVVMALTLGASKLADDRAPRYNSYSTKVDTLIKRIP
jgi:hypothetical protein